MATPRAPLFSVSLAFAIGCVAGLEQWIPLVPGLIVFAIAFGVWTALARRKAASLGAFYALVAAAGLAHTELFSTTIPRDDLRRLPDEKAFATTQWRGIIIQEPVAEVTAHPSRRALGRTQFVFRVQAWRPTGGRLFAAPLGVSWRPARGDVACTLLGPADDLACGDELQFASALESYSPPLVPGSLDERVYQGRQGIFYHTTLGQENWRRLAKGGGDFWQNLSFAARDWAYRRLQIGLEDDPRTADFLSGMLIGYRQEIPAEIEQDFRRTGTLHVFAVSGQNIAEMMVVAIVLLQLIGLVRFRWAWTMTPVILLYCLLTGSPASAVRATVMILVVLLAWRLGRPFNALACWSLAFLAMLVWDPSILEDPGAQLSFAVVLGLILLGPPLAERLRRPFAPDPFLPTQLLTPAQQVENTFWRRAALVLGATVAATLVSEPITAIDFHQVTPISVLANLIVVPMAGLITVVGTLTLTFSLVTNLGAAMLNNANWLFAKLLIAFVGFLAREPGASLNVPDLQALRTPMPALVVAPVQDSACLLLRLPGQAWLFNTGREVPARTTTEHLLQFYGINRLEGLVLTQIGVADNGGAEIIQHDFQPRRLVLPALTTRSPLQKVTRAMEASPGVHVEHWQRGDRFQLAADTFLSVLGRAGDDASTRSDDRGLVLLFCIEGRTLLWAGRSDRERQESLVQAYPNLRADMLVLDPQTAPSTSWLEGLQVRDWLQMPLHDSRLNLPSLDVSSSLRPWPLSQSGAVIVTFRSATAVLPGATLFRSWAAPPTP